MKYLYIIIALLAIFIVTFFTFNEDFLYYNYAKITIKKDSKIKENIYYYDEDFSYIDTYDGLEIHNKKELYESVYYLVNSGITNAKRYFDIDYTDFEEDFNELFTDEDKLNAINNFVHPYNSFRSINGTLDGYILEINIKYKEEYNNSNKNLIEEKSNEIINNLIDNDMDTKGKIKVLHDYIINNTTYDEDFCIEDDPKDCSVNSIYQSDTAYGVLFEHYGICSGYTDLMAIFLEKLNITNYRITNTSHTWNAVKINDVWYHLDTTWDDPISDEDILSHTYFLITTNEDSLLEDSHDFNREIFIELS